MPISHSNISYSVFYGDTVAGKEAIISAKIQAPSPASASTESPTAQPTPTIVIQARPVQSPVSTRADATLPPTVTLRPEITLPTPTAVLSATPRPPSPVPTIIATPTSSPVQIQHTAQYTDGSGLLHILGEVLNGTGAAIYDVRVVATYFNDDGSVFGTGSPNRYMPMVLNGEKVPFDIQLQKGWKSYPLSVSYQTTNTLGEAFSHSFRFVASQISPSAKGATITAQVTNTSGCFLALPEAVLTGYDASGTVILVDYAIVFSENGENLLPGQSATVTFGVPSDRANLVKSTATIGEGQPRPSQCHL
jgi:hypothetical protein